MNVVHRDLKGANILVDSQFNIKLADFGCSKCDDTTNSFTTIGSVLWMAPEVIVKMGYSTEADIWSMGCTVIEMATGKPPWGKLPNVMVAMRKIGMSDQRAPIPDSLSLDAQDFVSVCVQRNKDKRPSASELLLHRFMQGNIEELDINDF